MLIRIYLNGDTKAIDSKTEHIIFAICLYYEVKIYSAFKTKRKDVTNFKLNPLSCFYFIFDQRLIKKDFRLTKFESFTNIIKF